MVYCCFLRSEEGRRLVCWKGIEAGEGGHVSTRNNSLLVNPFPPEVGPSSQTKKSEVRQNPSFPSKAFPGNRQRTEIVMGHGTSRNFHFRIKFFGLSTNPFVLYLGFSILSLTVTVKV